MSAREQAQFRRLEESLRRALLDGARVPGVSRAPNVCDGRPVITGTRIPVLAIWELWAAGYEVAGIVAPDVYPHLHVLQVRAALRSMCVAVLHAKLEPQPRRAKRAA